VTQAILGGKTQVIDLDLAAYFDTVRHDLLVGKVACRIQDGEILHFAQADAGGVRQARGPPGWVVSPLLANIYLHEVDGMLERAKAVTRKGIYTYIEYARYADDRARPKPLF
jgi:RNA-directed DNA polymerase